MSSFLEKSVLITGGAGGLGKVLAAKAFSEGATAVHIWDNNRERLAAVEKSYKDQAGLLQTGLVDLAEPGQIKNAAEKIINKEGVIDILFNNAGMVIGKNFQDCTPGEIQKLNNLNVTGTMLTTRAFLPGMLKRGEGHIVNIASAAALIGNPRMSVYAASKWAMTGWSESIRLELEPDIKVTTVQPSYIKTGMFEGARAPLLTPLLDTEYIAEKIIQAVKSDKQILREPLMVKFLPFLRGVLPRPVFDLVAGKLFGVYRSMESFTGRKEE